MINKLKNYILNKKKFIPGIIYCSFVSYMFTNQIGLIYSIFLFFILLSFDFIVTEYYKTHKNYEYLKIILLLIISMVCMISLITISFLFPIS